MLEHPHASVSPAQGNLMHHTQAAAGPHSWYWEVFDPLNPAVALRIGHSRTPMESGPAQGLPAYKVRVTPLYERGSEARVPATAGDLRAGEDVVHRVLDAFERKDRGVPQAHMAAALVAEIRNALLAAQQETEAHSG
jgi:hypothetical protein